MSATNGKTNNASKVNGARGPTANSSLPPNAQFPGVFGYLWWLVLSLVHAGFPFVPWVRPWWSVNKMGDQSGKVVVITGANSGTGYETAKAYYQRGATVYMLCRSEERAAAAIEDIRKGGYTDFSGKMVYKPTQVANPGTLKVVQMDLDDLNSVDAAAANVLAQTQRIDILFANAGIMACPPGDRTKQGFPLQFGTNVLGHQRLIALLLPVLRKTSLATGEPARLISLSSLAHVAAPRGGIDYASLEKDAPFLDPWSEYNESKWGNVALAKYVDAHYGPRSASATEGKGEVVTVAVHPGTVATNLFQHNALFTWCVAHFTWAIRFVSATASNGALNQIWASQLPVDEARALSGGYVWCCQERGQARYDTNNPAAFDKLWEWCSAQAPKH